LKCENKKFNEVLLLGFREEDTDEEGFTPVVSRRNRKKMKSSSKSKMSMPRYGSIKSDGGAHSKSSAASVKVHNNHPLHGLCLDLE
jgi:hypothetical protein